VVIMQEFLNNIPRIKNSHQNVQTFQNGNDPVQHQSAEKPRLNQKPEGSDKAAAEKKATSETSTPMDTKFARQQAKFADGVRFSNDMKGQLDQNRMSLVKQRHFREEMEKMYSSFVNHEPTPEEISNAAKHASYSIWDIIKKARREGQDEEDDLMAAKILALLLKIHSDYTFEHSERVSDWTVALAEEMGIEDEEELENIEQAAFFKDIGMVGSSVSEEDEETRRILGDFIHDSKNFLFECSSLHDIGKMRIPRSIINKAAPLTDEEFAIIKRHPLIGVEILKSIPILHKAIPGVKHHHEKYDGSGYPDGLVGEEIPMTARIITVTDSFDAMIEDRPYRKALTPADAVNELIRLSGKQFDPKLIEPFIRVLIDREILQPDEVPAMPEL
jgi:HD-GYP domain-containing protein (c-di-GMP phosphodiesterase class II)